VVLTNFRYNENLVSRPGNDSFRHSAFLRQIFTDRTRRETIEDDAVWTFLAVPGAENVYRILNKASREFLIAGSNHSTSDFLRRRVFSVISDYPESFANDPAGHWLLDEKKSKKVRLVNIKYSEYLYASNHSRAVLDDQRRSVFTWKTKHDLGDEGFWVFKNPNASLVSDRPLTPAKYLITNYRRKEVLKASVGDIEATRSNIFTDRWTHLDMDSHSWVLERISGSTYCYKIRNFQSRAYLIAGSDQQARDPLRRRVFVSSRKSGKPTCSGNDDWSLLKHSKGYLIQNLKYYEYLYAADDDLALDDRRRSVFAWKTSDDLGEEGVWLFGKV
jgi:hypothetical protein